MNSGRQVAQCTIQVQRKPTIEVGTEPRRKGETRKDTRVEESTKLDAESLSLPAERTEKVRESRVWTVAVAAQCEHGNSLPAQIASLH